MKSLFSPVLIGATALATFSLPAFAQKPPSEGKAAKTEAATEAVIGTPFKVEAESEQGATTPEARVTRFFEQLKAKEINPAYKELLRGSKIGEVTKDVHLLESKTVEAIRFAGAITGSDLVERRSVGQSGHLLKLTYISLGKNFPLRWRFYFYQSEGNWRLIDIRISDRLPEMFNEEADEASEANSKE